MAWAFVEGAPGPDGNATHFGAGAFRLGVLADATACEDTQCLGVVDQGVKVKEGSLAVLLLGFSCYL